MPLIAKTDVKHMSNVKKVLLIVLMLAVIAAGLLLGSFINRRLHNRSFRATFVSNIYDTNIFESNMSGLSYSAA